MDIQQLKQEFGNNEEVLKVMGELKKKRQLISFNNTALATLFIQCYDYMWIHIKSVRDELTRYNNAIYNVEEVRRLVMDYNDPMRSGGNKYLDEGRISKIIIKNRDHYVKLINNFFEIFGE